MLKYIISFFLSSVFGNVYAANDTVITLLKYRQDLLSEVVDLWWSGQGACQQTHDEKPTQDLTERLMYHLNEEELPLCFIALKNNELVGMLRLSHHWAKDLSIVPAPKISAHPDWFPWMHGGCITLPGHANVVDALLEAAAQKVRKFGYKQIYLALFHDKDFGPYERYGFKRFDSDVFRGIPIDLFCRRFEDEEKISSDT